MSTRPASTRLAHLALALLAILAILILAAWDSTARSQASSEPTAPTNAAVHFSLPSGQYRQAIDIALSTPSPGADIYFTTDGSPPTPQNGTRYSGPIHLPADQPRTAVLRAAVQQQDGTIGPTSGATYFINNDAGIPLLSLTIDPQDLWDQESGIFTNPINSGIDWERDAELYYYDPQQGTGIQAPAGVRVHGASSREYDKKSLRLYFRDEYGPPALDVRVFPESEETSYKRLVIHNGGQDLPSESLNGTLLRNQLLGSLAREAGAYAGHSRPALLYINGQPWGLYNIRERIDSRYLAANFQIEEGDLLSGFENKPQVAAGDGDNWDQLIQFVEANNLSELANYDYIQTQINLDNFITYTLIQIITANADWPHNNQIKFRDRAGGRWHWLFWDSDYAFGLMSNSYIEKDMFQHTLNPKAQDQLPGSLLLRKLLENPQFKTQFLARLADLLNTVFTADHVLAEIDHLAAAVEREIPNETRRWPGPGNWEAGVEYMREFARLRPDIVRRQAVAAFDLPGTAALTIDLPHNSHGSVSINGGPPLGHQDLPWRGEYFQDVDLQLTAVPVPGYRFSGWEAAGNTPALPQTPALTLRLDGDLQLTPTFEKDSSHGAGSVLITGYGRDRDQAPGLEIDGDWLTLQVRDPRGVDLRGWRITDNDTLDAADEGSLILGEGALLANVPIGTTILLVARQTPGNDRRFAQDDGSLLDGQIVLYAGSDKLDSVTDPWFAIGENDTLYLLAPGPTASLSDDVLIDTLPAGR